MLNFFKTKRGMATLGGTSMSQKSSTNAVSPFRSCSHRAALPLLPTEQKTKNQTQKEKVKAFFVLIFEMCFVLEALWTLPNNATMAIAELIESVSQEVWPMKTMSSGSSGSGVAGNSGLGEGPSSSAALEEKAYTASPMLMIHKNTAKKK